MKKIVFSIAVFLLVLACKTEDKKPLDGYLITGDAPGMYNGIRVFLQSTDQRNRKINRDTAIVMNEKFVFEGKVAVPEIFYLSANSVKGSSLFLIENDRFHITLDKTNIDNTSIEGPKANSALKAYFTDVRELANKRTKMMGQLRTTKDKAVIDKVKADVINLTIEDSKIAYYYIDKNKDNSAALIFINNELNSKSADVEKLADALNGLDNNIKNSTLGNQTKFRIQQALKAKAQKGATDVGSIAPQFSGPTPEGKPLDLKSVMGKVTIIDFWASWCGPCRRENPNVVKVYEKYHNKGLEIIGVSLDGNSRQQNPKDAWIKAIDQDKLTWHHVSNLNYFNDPIAKAYNITAIPATFILDENGKIIAKNLRGPALEAKIKEILQ